MNESGTVAPSPDAPKIRITAVRAEHASAYVWRNPANNTDEVHVGGEPVGFIIALEDGFRVYHLGDTGLFADMAFISSYDKSDVVLIPIGGNFTMDPLDAAFATKEWLKPKVVIPMHNGTNPLAKGTAAQCQQALRNAPVKLIALKPGEKAEFWRHPRIAMRFSLRAAALILGAAVAASVAAQTPAYPGKPIRLVVPFTPGSSTDILARAIGQELTHAWGQSVIVDNVPGAGGAIVAMPGTPEAFGQHMARAITRWKPVITSGRVKAD